MRNIFKLLPALVLLSLFSCTKVDSGIDFSRNYEKPGVYGYLTPIVFDDVPATKGSADPNTLNYIWEEGDRINIWSNTGTLLIYTVDEVTDDGRAVFSGGGFTLTDGETYYSSHPLILSVRDDYKTLTTSYVGETQTADNDARHIADYIYTYSSAPCVNGHTSFQYHHISSFIKFAVTLPEALTLTELTLTADNPLFALNGTVDVTTGAFTPGDMSAVMTLALDNVVVSDKVLNASLAVAPYNAGNFVVRVKDSEGNVYTSLVIAKPARGAGQGTLFEVEVFPGENPAVAQIGDAVYSSLAEAVEAVPADGTATTITMIGNATVLGNAGVTIPSGKNVVLDLNGKTITGAFDQPSTAQVITNKGTLTITDSSTDKNGTITVSVSDENAGSPSWNGTTYDKNWASNVIRNESVLVMNAGNLVNVGNGSACYAIDNYTAASLTVNGGKLDAVRASAVRMFYMNGGSVTVNDGIIGSSNSYMGLQIMGTSTNGINVSLNGGTFSGQYGVYAGGGNASWATSHFSISGGTFVNGASFTGAISAANIDVTGGEYQEYLVSYGTERFIKGGTFTEDAMLESAGYVAEGYKFVADGTMYIVVPNSDPREAIATNTVYYYWLNGDGSRDGGFYNFYAPFEGPDPVLMDGEFIELLSNIKLTKDVSYLESCDFGDPIFKGGTFYLTFGDYSINLNGYAFPIPTGVKVKTDKQTDIFSPAVAGYEVVETSISEGNFHYQYTVAKNVAQIGSNKYETLQAALDAAHEMTGDVTITLIADVAGYSIVHQKEDLNVTIDGAQKTVDGQIIIDGDGRASGTETLTISNIKFQGDKTNFVAGTDAFVLVPSLKTAGTPYYNNKYNYAHNITVSNCSFTSTSSSLDIVAFKSTSGAGDYNTSIVGCTGTNLHSLAQFTGTTGGTITNNTVSSSESFVNVSGGTGAFAISGNTFTTSEGSDGYGIRENGSSTAVLNLSDNNFTAFNSIKLGKSGSATNGTINVTSGTYNGTIVKDIAATATGKIVISGGSFDVEPNAEFIAEGYKAVEESGRWVIVEKLPEAKIGSVEYLTLQAALDAAHEMTGDVTITLIADVAGYSIVHQKEGLNVTIDGAQKTVNGQIIIDGDNRNAGTETLTITNVKFQDDKTNFSTGTDAFILVPSLKTAGTPYYNNKNNYAHNITVSNCSFTSTSSALDVVGLKTSSGGGSAYNVVVTGCTGTNLHSLAQLTGTTDGAFTNNTVSASESFVNVSGGDGTFAITGNTFTTSEGSDGYGIRENGTSTAVLNLSNNNFTAFDAVKLGKGNSVTAGTINVASGTYSGNLVKEAAATGSIVITGGTFSADPTAYVASGYKVVADGGLYTVVVDTGGGNQGGGNDDYGDGGEM